MMVDPISGYIMACLTLRTLTMVPASMTLLMLLSPVSSYLHMSVMLRTQQCLPPGTGCPLLTPQLTDTAGLCSQSPQLTEGLLVPPARPLTITTSFVLASVRPAVSGAWLGNREVKLFDKNKVISSYGFWVRNSMRNIVTNFYFPEPPKFLIIFACS